MKASDIEKIWVDTKDELVGPFETQKEAQEYIDDRDDHGFNVQNWDMITFQKWYTSYIPEPKNLKRL